MKKLLLVNLVIFLMTVIFMAGAHMKPLLAASGGSFTQVVPFSTPAGLLGFFDQSDGNIYLYDQNFKDCVLQYRVSKLGGPLVKVAENKSGSKDRFGSGW